MRTVANMKYFWLILVIAVGAADSIVEKANLETANLTKGTKHYRMELLFKATFFQASMYCSRLGMELVSFNNLQEFDELKDFLVKTLPNARWSQFWTSGVAMGPLQFGWINTGLPITVTHKWEYLQPNNFFGLENCVEVKFHESINVMLMNDITCLALNYIVCQGYTL
ncbi:PREDICTED: C-type lectin 37Da-like [Nicrophorus vespilloides]|uniref:C-type lectin 37Da-like n=1 Tax=Nicrophorus vespilloides TaxID=110193 RepID=A0ABM1M9E4_NICVS|nr:PREDICTED: C-type lectin 37Da-like [Nicrophorus vespilloides]